MKLETVKEVVNNIKYFLDKLFKPFEKNQIIEKIT